MITMLIRAFIIIPIIYLPSSFTNESNCSVFLEKAEIINSEFYINFEKVISEIFSKKGYVTSKDKKTSQFIFKSHDYITVSSSFFKLQQVNLNLKMYKSDNVIHSSHALKNCFTVSCPANQYVKALNSSLKIFEKNLIHCSKQITE